MLQSCVHEVAKSIVGTLNDTGAAIVLSETGCLGLVCIVLTTCCAKRMDKHTVVYEVDIES